MREQAVFFRGLSPRVRGNLMGIRQSGSGSGSIPACAGEPIPRGAGRGRGRVYPRVCGGTNTSSVIPLRGVGLSPRVRGNRLGSECYISKDRSIPACAGEPTIIRHRGSLSQVYPRVCGGTLTKKPYDHSANGLSPRVRGNHPLSALDGLPGGSIPACAGEPLAI